MIVHKDRLLVTLCDNSYSCLIWDGMNGGLIIRAFKSWWSSEAFRNMNLVIHVSSSIDEIVICWFSRILAFAVSFRGTNDPPLKKKQKKTNKKKNKEKKPKNKKQHTEKKQLKEKKKPKHERKHFPVWCLI